ncbi:uncharacterized protein LOC142786783 isoform X2 [Rhipicephalus microplus]|uniref:uncharacterized protein LOC142786783 isoform X2 n=1 Tax=Rhipicephalus microplus TaxID=6941 RepID=UPI003F6B8FFC
MTTIKEVLQQYQSGAGRYSYCIVSDITTVPQAVAAQKDDNEDFDLYRPCIALHEDLPPEHSEGLERPRMRAESSRVQAGIGKGALRYGAPTIHKCFKKIRKQCLPNDFYGL